MKVTNKKPQWYLDVTQMVYSGPFSPQFSPIVNQPIVQMLQVNNLNSSIMNIEDNTPLNKPLYIELDKQQAPSPYLKQLLSKVGSAEVQFLDFTLEGQIDEQSFEAQDGQQKNDQSMSVIEEQESQIISKDGQCEQVENENINVEDNPQLFVPNMHLLEIDPNTLDLNYFQKKLKSGQFKTQQQKRQFLSLYLTQQDYQQNSHREIDYLIKIVKKNLQKINGISRIVRKRKVVNYLLKKRRRVWKKKVNYDCRKKVADNRLRVKGKFVTSQQACKMLGIELCSIQQLKELIKK